MMGKYYILNVRTIKKIETPIYRRKVEWQQQKS